MKLGRQQQTVSRINRKDILQGMCFPEALRWSFPLRVTKGAACKIENEKLLWRKVYCIDQGINSYKPPKFKIRKRPSENIKKVIIIISSTETELLKFETRLFQVTYNEEISETNGTWLQTCGYSTTADRLMCTFTAVLWRHWTYFRNRQGIFISIRHIRFW
jgi:hypothetical protein